MSKTKSPKETPRTDQKKSSAKKPRDKRSHREIVEANLKALKNTRLAFL